MNVEISDKQARALRWVLLTLVIALTLSLVACGGLLGGNANTGGERVEGDAPNELPTIAAGEEVGAEALAAATDDYNQTWANYLRDIIAEQVKDRQQKIDLLQRYADPDVLNQEASNHVQNIELVVDRSVLGLQSNGVTVLANGDFDLRYTYLNGDSLTVTCKQTFQMQKRDADGLWYVVNPGSLQIFSVCQ